MPSSGARIVSSAPAGRCSTPLTAIGRPWRTSIVPCAPVTATTAGCNTARSARHTSRWSRPTRRCPRGGWRAMRRPVGGTAPADTEMRASRPAEILERAADPLVDDLDHVRTNRTRSPAIPAPACRASRRTSARRCGRSRCQPPGLTVGYTPVNSLAIATEPAVIDVRGVERRGNRNCGDRPTR